MSSADIGAGPSLAEAPPVGEQPGRLRRNALALGFLFPAIFFLGVWILFQLWDGGFAILHPQPGGGVAFFAHIGGFAFGLLTVHLIAKRRPLQPSW